MTKSLMAIMLALFVALPSAVWAQAKPDLSGTWTFDEAKSEPAPARAGGGGGGGGRGGGRGGAPATAMTIKQTPTELTIERTLAQGPQTVVLKLDGTASPASADPGAAVSKATWDGAKLVVASTQTMQARGGGEPMTVESKDVYSVDGKVLTIETTRTTPAGAVSRKLVYTKP